MTKASVSVLVTTFNEELNIEGCLRSVEGWPQEIFVVDSYSSDRTPEICSRYGAVVVNAPSQRIADLKNWALKTLPFSAEWVLILDADERVTSALRDEITNIATNSKGFDGYYINRRFIFYGKWMRCWYPSWNLRLFKHRLGRYEDRKVHEHVILNGRAGRLENDMIHEDRRDLTDWIAKHNKYATAEAHENLKILMRIQKTGFHGSFLKKGVEFRRALKDTIWIRLPARPLLYFLYLYIFKLGFLDGGLGFKFCFMHAIFEYFTVIKLWELQRIWRI